MVARVLVAFVFCCATVVVLWPRQADQEYNNNKNNKYTKIICVMYTRAQHQSIRCNEKDKQLDITLGAAGTSER